MSCAEVLVVRIERRRVAVAVMSGVRLDYVQVRELPSDYVLARRAARRFVAWAVEAFNPEHLILELSSPRQGTRVADLRTAVYGMLSRYTIARTYLRPGLGRQVIGLPKVSGRELREAANSIWPQTRKYGKGSGEEAAVLGLYYQLVRCTL